MQFDFDSEVEQFGTGSAKWEFTMQDGEFIQHDLSHPEKGDERMLPLSVAVMDFKCPPAIIDALIERAKNGIFGYTAATDSYYEAVIDWAKRRYNWEIKKEWITVMPGVVPALNLMIQTYTQPGDKIIIQRPVYHPFIYAIENNDRVLVSNTLVYQDGRYKMDFDDLAAKAADPEVKMLVLCSPHNPVGRVWTKEELTKLGRICIDNNVLIIADEIHCDLIFDDVTFTSFASISEEFAQHSITCIAPSKTFNLAGLKTSNIIFPNSDLQATYNKTLEKLWIKGGNSFGLVAAEAGYRHGEEWLEAVMNYIQENYNFLVNYLQTHIPHIKAVPMEGTYLAWLDCSALGLSPEAQSHLFKEGAKLFLNDGQLFGPEGEAFERINLACPRSLLETALGRIKEQVQQLTVAAD